MATARKSVWVVCHHTGPEGTKFLLARRSKKANASGQWNFFGGGVDEAEMPYLSAARELHEEAGITAPKQHMSMLASHKMENGKIIMFFNCPLKSKVKAKLNVEHSKAEWLSLTKIMGLKLHAPTEWFFFNALEKITRG